MLYLNTAFAGPQLVDVLEREKPALVVHDEEFTEMLDRRPMSPSGLLAWSDGPDRGGSRAPSRP